MRAKAAVMLRPMIAKDRFGPIAREVSHLAKARAGSVSATLRILIVLLGVAFLGFITLLVLDTREPIAERYARIVSLVRADLAPRVEPAASPRPVPLPRIVTSGEPPAAPDVPAAARPKPSMPVVQRPGKPTPGPMPLVVTPSTPVGGGNTVVAHRSSNGHFFFDVAANGTQIRMMFDTGASAVALRAEDAQHMGIDLSTLVYSARTSTANGMAMAAPYTIERLTIGDITVTQVQAMVARRGALTVSLLGQSFMTRLVKYNVAGNALTIEGR